MNSTPTPPRVAAVPPHHLTSTGRIGERQRPVLALIAEVEAEKKKLD